MKSRKFLLTIDYEGTLEEEPLMKAIQLAIEEHVEEHKHVEYIDHDIYPEGDEEIW